eukprot:7172944-Heterocapsa_arctica.AAC.1
MELLQPENNGSGPGNEQGGPEEAEGQPPNLRRGPYAGVCVGEAKVPGPPGRSNRKQGRRSSRNPTRTGRLVA